MTLKAMENANKHVWWIEIGGVVLACLAGAALGFWVGGWYQSERLQAALVEIPDINQCYQ